ncbi:LacI family DNA-binding transcriptional regulator, partial [Acinetobacter baumannii]
VTIKDVAREADVSIKTVSRVLNNERYVGEETRRRVADVVARLNFRPSVAARSLAGRRSFQIALICDNPSPYYVYEMQS